ncbi:phage tail tape measure protein [Gellertiella hungarica]|uniref:Muramidase (Phage lysozyme) n=1 Tax=Gellertiella hungarica TaxID=1572859 RepID=A0A7W6NMN5_9HYPH|nr:phage tail tape measure protein [Gellertiella hungarica]MBB4067163.1 muramidase (phage lysozyme) [Gellertiella hungarica]
MTELLPGLVVDIEGRVDKLEKAMAKANAIQRRGANAMETRARQSAKALEDTYSKSFERMGGKLEKAMSVFARGGAAFAAIAGAGIAVKEIASSIAEVDREARKAGVSAKVWQQWSYVATATGMSIDGMTDALKELNIRGDEFARTGKGSAEEAFKRLGYTVSDVAERLRDPSRFMDEIIGKLRTLDKAAQTRILDEVFGGTGAEELAKVLGMSVSEVQKLRSEAATFSDEQIEAAKKIDAEWETMWRNFTVNSKSAAIAGVSVAEQIMEAIQDITDPNRDLKARIAERLNSPEYRLKELEAKRAEILKALERERANPLEGIGKELELKQLQADLRAIEEEIHDVTGGSDEFKNALKELSAASRSMSGSFDSNTNSAQNFKAALSELKALFPDLKTEMDRLSDVSGIDAAYQRAVANARTMGEVLNATDLANRARSVATFGINTNMLDLIGAAEGTDRGRGYNETLGYGAFTGGAVNLTGMTLDQVIALQTQMLRHPANTFNSSAVGRYQITRTTLQSLIQELGLTGDRMFDQETQDELARALLRRRGNDPAGLRNEWEGLRRVDDSTIRNAYTGTATGAQPLTPTDNQQRQTEILRQQAEARRNLNMSVEEGLRLAEFERSISGMSESQQRIELQLFRVKEEARRNGITLSNEEIAKLREQITLTQRLDTENQKTAKGAEGLKNAQQFFAQSFTSSLSGLLTGTTSLNQAVQNLLNSLIDATLQAALLGQGPLAGLFGGMGSGILGGLFGFSEGGYTGDGAKYAPAGVVHRGEYVMSKKATSRIGVQNLEALHNGALRGFADGGFVGNAPSYRPLKLKNAGSAAPNIQINAPVTVNATGGTPQQNEDLAKRVSKEMDATMRNVVVDELRRQMRPGNMLNNGRRG